MRALSHVAILGSLILLLEPLDIRCQWNTGGGGNQYLSSPTVGVVVGTTTTSPPSALTVYGNQMTPTTGEVFQTITANNVDSYWRMNRGGEMGQIFSLMSPQGHSQRTLRSDAVPLPRLQERKSALSDAFSGDPDRIRTCNQQNRNLPFYPVELRGRFAAAKIAGRSQGQEAGPGAMSGLAPAPASCA